MEHTETKTKGKSVEKKTAPKAEAEVSLASQPVQKVWRGQETFEHSLFKLLPAECKKNRSFKPGSPKIEDIAHGHKYHSSNRKGSPNQYCAPTAGHFHEVKVVWNGDSLVSVECGPPLRYRWRQMKSGRMRKVLERIVYDQDEDRGNGQPVEDNHTHEVQYMRSEVLNLQRGQKQVHMPDYVSDKYGAEAARVARQALRE